MTTRLLFRTQFVEGSADRDAPDVVWAVWEFAAEDDMFAPHQEPLYTEFLRELRPFVVEHGGQTHVLAEVGQG